MKKLMIKLRRRSVGWLGRCLQALDRWSPVDLNLSSVSFMSHTFLFRDLENCQELLSGYYASVNRELRILCVGCATGQEPYSVAILCHAAGIPVHITAFDLSEPAIVVAQHGAYDIADERRKAEEGPDYEALRLLEKFDGYFELANGSSGRRQVRQEVRRTIEFYHKDAATLREENVFDFIFCKKMLRYLPSGKRRGVLVAMQRALKRGVHANHLILDSYTKRLLGITEDTV